MSIPVWTRSSLSDYWTPRKVCCHGRSSVAQTGTSLTEIPGLLSVVDSIWSTLLLRTISPCSTISTTTHKTSHHKRRRSGAAVCQKHVSEQARGNSLAANAPGTKKDCEAAKRVISVIDLNLLVKRQGVASNNDYHSHRSKYTGFLNFAAALSIVGPWWIVLRPRCG